MPNVSIDCYEQRANDGTYLLTDRCSETGVATLSWYALGDVDHYNILITDEKGTKSLFSGHQPEHDGRSDQRGSRS